MSAIPSSESPILDRRAAVRHPCDLDTFLRSLHHPELDRSWPARVRDISTTGIGMFVAEVFREGTELEIELQSTEQGITYTLLTRVTRISAPDAEGQRLLGCVFARPLTETELRQLL